MGTTDAGGRFGGEVAVRLGGSRQDDEHHAEEVRFSRGIPTWQFELATGKEWRNGMGLSPRAGRHNDRIYLVAPRFGGWTVTAVFWVKGSRRGAL
jgi:hypothetical protein